MRNAAVVATFILLAAAPAAAQQPRPAARPVTGVVLDSVTGHPIAGALVRLGQRQVATDGGGRFRLDAVPDGTATFSFSRLGYGARLVTVLVGADTPPLSLVLAPDPVRLEAITVLLDTVVRRRLDARRFSLGIATNAFDRKTLLDSNAPDLHNFVVTRAGIQAAACAGGRMAQFRATLGGPMPREAFGPSGWTGCVWKRGVLVHSAIYVDEKQLTAEQLHDYAPRDMYLLEVYGDGLMIRGYTSAWIQRTRAESLLPIY